MMVKFLSWNIWMGKYLPKILDLLEKEKPDVIALQEVVRRTGETQNTAEIIAERLGYQWIFAPVPIPFHDKGIAEWGEGILSKYDIEASEVLDLSEDPKHIGLQADIRVGNELLHVISTHLTHTHQQPSEHQESEARSLVRLSPKEHTIIAGDFNALPESNAITVMHQKFQKADPDNNPTWCVYKKGCTTCLYNTVKYRLDYIFTTSDIRVSDYRVRSSRGSDHLPIASTVSFAGTT